MSPFRLMNITLRYLDATYYNGASIVAANQQVNLSIPGPYAHLCHPASSTIPRLSPQGLPPHSGKARVLVALLLLIRHGCPLVYHAYRVGVRVRVTYAHAAALCPLLLANSGPLSQPDADGTPLPEAFGGVQPDPGPGASIIPIR